MNQIVSFTVDHTKLMPGMYLFSRQGNITTFDLRFKKPNSGDLLTNSELHSTEHLVATFLRNAPEKDAVIYFGPMGCQTGFYFLFDNQQLTNAQAVELVKRAFASAADYSGPMPGKAEGECGNYRNLDVPTANAVCRWYTELIADWTEEKLAY